MDEPSAVSAPGLPQTAIRCPVCSSIDWFRNCNTLAMDEATGEVDFRCVLPHDPALVASSWACMSCAYEVPEPGSLHDRLNAMAGGRQGRVAAQPD